MREFTQRSDKDRERERERKPLDDAQASSECFSTLSGDRKASLSELYVKGNCLVCFSSFLDVIFLSALPRGAEKR